MSINQTEHLIEIAVPVVGVPHALTYTIPAAMTRFPMVGKRVVASVGTRKIVGVVTRDARVRAPEGFTLKPIERVLDESPIVSPAQMDLCRFVAEYYMAPLGETLRMCVPPDLAKGGKQDFAIRRRRAGKKSQSRSSGPGVERTLTPEQQSCVNAVLDGKASSFLLEGVTGSGKTVVYIAITKAMLAQDKSVLVIVPEISLTPQLVAEFQGALQTDIVALHSNLTQAKRRDALLALSTREARVVIGARSALFANMPSLGLIVVDEEHDASFKQDETPRYHARDVALWRARHEGAKIVLGSATPSLESLVNVQAGRLVHLQLTNRIGGNGLLPKVEVIDLRARAQHKEMVARDRSLTDGGTWRILSGPLKEALVQTLERKEQALIFLNRRGYATFAVCDACGEIRQCAHCSVSLTYYQSRNLLRCHQCDHSEELGPFCPSCNEGPVMTFGLGTERIEAELQACFPEAKIARLDRDVVRRTGVLQQIVTDMKSLDTDILIGTQMVAKGHDFPGVSLVGVILADTGLAMPDFRAAERTFQVLTQVSGRAGRGDKQGRVIVQTFNPGHPSIAFAKHHDVKGFMALELESRKLATQPPFSRAALLRLDGDVLEKTEEISKLIGVSLRESIKQSALQQVCHLLGPAPAAYERLRGKWRFQLYLRAANTKVRAQVLDVMRADRELEKTIRKAKCRLIIDVDPVHML